MWEHEFQEKLLHLLKEQTKLLENIVILLREPESIQVKWSINGMSTNVVNLNLDATAKAVGVVTELNNDGSVFKFDPTKISAAVQDLTVVSAVVDPTTGDPTVTPLKVGSTNVIVADTATGVQSPVYTFTVTQVGPSPTSLSVSWTVTP